MKDDMAVAMAVGLAFCASVAVGFAYLAHIAGKIIA